MDMIAAIEDLQIDVNALAEKLEGASQEIQKINGTLRNHRSLNSHLESEIAKLKRELSSCIDVKLLYSDRQARETWQQGCDVMIETLHKRIIDMDFMLKNSLLCVDNSHTNDAAKYLAPIAQLNACVKEELTGAMRIVELERALECRNIECIAALNESNSFRERVVEISKQLQDANREIHLLKNPYHSGCKL